jgi:hypothetical protein
LAAIDAPFSIESIYAHSRLLLRQGSLARLPRSIRQLSAQLRDRALLRDISAQHCRLWKRLIVMLIVKNRKAPKHLVMGDAEGGGVRRLALRA